MTGEKLRIRLKNAGYRLPDLSKQLGHKNVQNIYSLLRVSDVSSNFIEGLAQVTGRPISWFYGIDGEDEHKVKSVSASAEQAIAVSGDNNSIVTISERFIGLLEQKDKQLNQLLDILTKTTKER